MRKVLAFVVASFLVGANYKDSPISYSLRDLLPSQDNSWPVEEVPLRGVPNMNRVFSSREVAACAINNFSAYSDDADLTRETVRYLNSSGNIVERTCFDTLLNE